MKHYRKIGNRYVELDSYRKPNMLHSKMFGKVLDATAFVLMSFIVVTAMLAAAGIDITQLHSHQEIHCD